MSDYDLSRMEEYMAREPRYVSCTQCGWDGDESQLVNGNCPKCGSYAIEYDMPDELMDEKNK